DNMAVTGYLIERCAGTGCTNFTQISTATVTTYSDTGVVAGNTYNYHVRARDAANNLCPFSNTATAVTPAPDTQAPTAPTNLSASAVSGTQVNLTTTVRTDNIAVTGYLIERCTGTGCTTFSQISTATVTAYSDTGVVAGNTYNYHVRA